MILYGFSFQLVVMHVSAIPNFQLYCAYYLFKIKLGNFNARSSIFTIFSCKLLGFEKMYSDAHVPR